MALQIALNTLGLQTLYMGVNSRNPSKSGLFALKVGVYSRKPPKNRTFQITWGSIQEWGCSQADRAHRGGTHAGIVCLDYF